MIQKNILQRKADAAFEQQPKVSGEFFALTYGSLVRQLTRDFGDDIDSVNQQLFEMGLRIGHRLADEYLAKSGVEPCRSFRDTATAVATVGAKMFLGVEAEAVMRSEDGNEYSVVLRENPLALYVELPEAFRKTLWYSNVLCGVVQGALSMVGYDTRVAFKSDTLRGDEVTEVTVKRVTEKGK